MDNGLILGGLIFNATSMLSEMSSVKIEVVCGVQTI